MSPVCGIAGILARAGVEELEPALHRMLGALRHRGPDDSGCEAVAADPDGALVLGATRLAIQDTTAAGHQPMRDPATGNWILLNGEIYNHHDVRRALGGEGWRSRSDTETVLRAYGTWGPACLDRLKGMFAVALWDARDRSLWCARDRFGIKPFYYASDTDGFAFGSEVRALLASGRVPRRLDRHGLAGYVRFGSVPGTSTLVEGVTSLAPGHWMRVRAGGRVEVRPYWRPRAGPAAADAPDAAAELRDRLDRAVREHLLSDVPVAAFLSGGLDSSVVTALAASASPRRLQTFTVAFVERALDESAAARAVAARCGTDHREVRLSDSEATGLAVDAVDALDLPSADGLNTFLVSRAVAGAGVKVVLSGLGGDELFGGYRSFRLLGLARRWSPLVGGLPASLRRLAGRGGSGERAAEMTARDATLVERYEALRSLWSRHELETMGLDPSAGYGTEDPGPDAPDAARVSVLELRGYLQSTLLRDADAMSMAHSLELRVPFLDHELVDSALRAAAARGAWPRYKPALRRATRGLLPPGTASAGKRGFVLPMDRWLRGPLRPLLAEGLDALAASRALPGADMRATLRRFEAGELSWARPWSLAVLGRWLDRHRVAA